MEISQSDLCDLWIWVKNKVFYSQPLSYPFVKLNFVAFLVSLKKTKVSIRNKKNGIWWFYLPSYVSTSTLPTFGLLWYIWYLIVICRVENFLLSAIDNIHNRLTFTDRGEGNLMFRRIRIRILRLGQSPLIQETGDFTIYNPLLPTSDLRFVV